MKWLRWFYGLSSERLIRAACVLGLVALPLMIWSLFDPTVWPVLVALSAGQAIGTLSFALFLFTVARDLNVRRKLRRGESAPPSTGDVDRSR